MGDTNAHKPASLRRFERQDVDVDVGGNEGNGNYAPRFKRVPSLCNGPVMGLTD